ncbi:hypothetical protein CGMCC3_g7845 [Colletotrichum fructicola]|nr:uncharacterized protein CGMCC3_g7845 [Colletotrichum fructicola]KAE9576206.1 hypothetical protein CGMCC3_g7845 [Colletotrichum fructicola]
MHVDDVGRLNHDTDALTQRRNVAKKAMEEAVAAGMRAGGSTSHHDASAQERDYGRPAVTADPTVALLKATRYCFRSSRRFYLRNRPRAPQASLFRHHVEAGG